MNGQSSVMAHRWIIFFLSAFICLFSSHWSMSASEQNDESRGGPVLEGVIAVIPFFSRSEQPDYQWVGAGIATSVSSDLSQLGLSVLAQETVSSVLEGLGSALGKADAEDRRLRQSFLERGAVWLIDGSVQHVGPLLRITARIVESETGSVLYTVRFDGTSRELFDLQDRIAEALAKPFLVIPQVEPEELGESLVSFLADGPFIILDSGRR